MVVLHVLVLALQFAAQPDAASGRLPPIGATPTPVVPAPATPAPTAPGPPRKIDELDRPLTGAVPQGSYEVGVRGAFSRRQSLQGPLDGTWILKDAGGVQLYRVQLVDPGFAGGALEGAWQDLHSGSAMAGSGFFSGISREGGRLTLQFVKPGAGLMVATLDQRADGAFAGDLRGSAGAPTSVTLARP